MQTNGRSRFLAALLALVMVITLMPLSVFAEEAPAALSAQLVTDASELKTGDVILLTASKDGKMFTAGNFESKYLKSIETTEETLGSDAVLFTLGGEKDAWTLTSEDGQMYTNAAKALNFSDKGVGTWKISIEDGLATIASTNSDFGRILYNVNTPRFMNYTSATNTSMLLPSIYKVSIEENHVIESLDELTDGAQVVIYNPANMMALSSVYTGNYNSGVALTEKDGKLSGFEETELWTVGVNDDGTYTFSTVEGKKLAMSGSYTSMPLDSQYADWTVSANDGGYYIDNMQRSAVDGKGRIEWYAGNNNWSAYKTTSEGDLFVQQFYLVVEPLEEEDDDDDTIDTDGPLKAGDLVVIYNPANMKALSTTYDGYYNSAVDVKLTDGVLSGFYDTEVWVVGVNEDGTYTFRPYLGGDKLAMNDANSSMPLGGAYPNWAVSEAKTEGCYYIMNTQRAAYIEYYSDKGTWSAYYNNANEALFAQCFYKVDPNGEDIISHDTGDLPKNGDEIVIYNASAGAALGMPNELNTALDAAPTFLSSGDIAHPGNGARVFTVGVSGNDYTFKTGDLYLASDDTESLFLTDDETANIKWNLEKGSDGYIIYSKDSRYNGSGKVCIEFFGGSFSGWTFKSATREIFEFGFYPVAQGITVIKGIVDMPEVTLISGDAFIGMDYKFEFDIESVFGFTAPESITFNGEAVENISYVNHFTVEIPAEKVTGSMLVFTVSGTDREGAAYSATFNIPVCDEPVITDVNPSANSVTGDNKRPVISAKIVNGGDNPTVSMTVNKQQVDAVFENGVITYTPAKDMADGKVTVVVNVTREDGKTAVKSWSFNVGEMTYQLFFGQLHSHTAEYSDGAGTLADGLNYIKHLPESANVQFVAFTDHSNYFDASGSANPEQALYDMSQATAASQTKWESYKSTIAAFNEEQSDVIAIGGFEMTWSGGPGHINTFNTPGIVSRNNTTLNNKTSDAGMKAYYALLSQAEGAGSISQLNHPGKTFGNFSDFAYWDAVIDSRVFLVEVGNGEGAIGSNGYFPSYEQYIMALDKGWHVAPTNNQDNHKGKWGNANDARDVILTDDFSEEGIYNALRSMRVYSTEDKNLEIYYSINGLSLGSIISEVPETLDFEISVADPDSSDTIYKVEIVANSGKVVYTWDKASDLASGQLSISLAPDYTYYFIRVTEGDGDIAVTAPIWVGESLKLGISAFECGTSTPVTGEELTLKTTVFNSEATDAILKSVTYTTDGSKVLGTDTKEHTIPASGNYVAEFKYTPDVAKVMTVTATVVIEQDGKEYTFTKDITLDILNADELVYIGIDGSHHNEYVAGNYLDSMGNFGELAGSYSVRTVQLNTSAELIAACSNDKFKAIILTAPSRRDGTVLRTPYDCYTDAEIAALVDFNNAGGALILAGWSDYYESYSVFPEADHMAAQQNKILEAIGSSLRIADDGTNDDSLNGGQTQRLYFSTYNMDNFLMNGVEVDNEHPNDVMYTERFSHYGGASIYVVDASGVPTSTVPATVSPVVYGHASTYSVDSDNVGVEVPKYAVADGDNRLMIMATEQLDGKGLVVVSGAAFMSNFEVQYTVSDSGAEKNYSNFKICENLVQYINPVTVTPIATVQKQTETGYKYTIEGVVTTNASGYDKDTAFFDCIYVQDATGGVCCFPVAGDYKIGDKVRVTGTTDFYQGEMELQVTSIQKIGEGETVVGKEVTSAQINDLSVLGQFITLKGTVQSFTLENGLVQTIMVRDAKGELARVFIDGYICSAKDVENLQVGCEITVSGVSSYDDTFNAPTGPFPRIRINDRSNIICGEVVADPFSDIAGSGYHDYIVEAAKAGIINGYNDGTFRPKAEVTRAQFITMLYRAVGSPEVSGELSFADAGNIASAYKPAVVWGVQNGIIAGYGDNTFRPNQNISRAQMATFMYRYLKNVAQYDFGDVSVVNFYDAGSIAAPYKDAVNAIVSAGIMNGTSTTTFAPNATANRGMAATVILRVYKLLNN